MTSYCWGNNINGTLGDGSTQSKALPSVVSGGIVFNKIISGFDASCGIEDVTNNLYCWGAWPIGHVFNVFVKSNLYDDILKTPKKISDGSYKDMSMSSTLCVQRMSDDKWECIGRNDHGQVGAGFISAYGSDPAIVPATDSLVLIDTNVNLRDLKINNFSACGLDDDGKVWCWGGDDFGQLGRPISAPSMSYTRPQRTLWNNQYKSIYSGSGRFYCGITLDDRLECWGSNLYCELARPKVDSAGERFIQSDVPVEIQGLPKDWVSVAVGAWFGCVLTTEGDVWCWGSAPSDEDPDQNLNCDPVPRKVPSFPPAP
jgi:alpha-tubulin suppressor-like RCC1 family protein